MLYHACILDIFFCVMKKLYVEIYNGLSYIFDDQIFFLGFFPVIIKGTLRHLAEIKKYHSFLCIPFVFIFEHTLKNDIL